MAKFGADVTEVAPTQSHTQVREGVVQEPVALRGLANVFSGVGDFLDKKRESKQEAFLTDFSNQQLAVIQALDQGVPGMSSRFARTKLRNNLMGALETHPGLREELLKTNSSLLGQAGMGDIVNSGTKEEIRMERIRSAADEAGLTIPGASSDEDYNRAASVLQQRAAAQQQYELEMQNINREKGRLDLTSKQRTELEAREKKASESFIISAAPSELDRFTTHANGLINNSEMSQAEKLTSLEEYWINLNQEFSTYVANIDSVKADALMVSFQRRKDLTEKLIKGEMEQAEFDRKIKASTSLIQSRLLEDEEIALAVATSELFGQHIAPFAEAHIQRITARILNQNNNTSEPPANPFVGESDRKAIKEYLNSVSTAPDTPAAQEEQRTHIERILQGAEDYSNGLARNPETGIALVDWMASSQFLEMRNKYPDLFEDTSALEEAIGNHYHEEVRTLIAREFTNNSVTLFEEGEEPTFTMMGGISGGGTLTTTPTPDMVRVEVTPNGVNFVAHDKNNSEAVRSAKHLNRQVKPLVNQVVKSAAHLEGRTDYSVIAQQELENMFGGNVNQNNDAGDDLDLQDFSLGGEILDEALTTGGFIGDGDFTNAETPEDVAASFIGLTERQHTSVISNFIKEATGNSLNPAKTAWCAAFVNAALGASGEIGTGSNLARSFLNWGEPVTTPQRGDIVVFSRGRQAWQGHVGFFVGRDEKGNIKVLGGNQGDKVSIETYPPSKLLGYRRGKADV